MIRQATTPLLLTAEEAAELLHIGRSKVYDLIRNGDLRSIKIGRLRRVPLDAVHEFAAQPSPEGVVA
ncbi:MAG TPA: helix-turn-helix domain-containing protein [Pseudonocardia sp.]|nr:helix-turn-helix domain-containing protein [Pseudonocardia sp.]